MRFSRPLAATHLTVLKEFLRRHPDTISCEGKGSGNKCSVSDFKQTLKREHHEITVEKCIEGSHNHDRCLSCEKGRSCRKKKQNKTKQKTKQNKRETAIY